MGSKSITQDELAIRQLKKCSVLLVKNAGFEQAEAGAIDELTELLLDYIAGIVEECQNLAVLGGRGAFNLYDLTDALSKIDVKQNIEDVITYITEHKFTIKPNKEPKEPRGGLPHLRIGDDRPMPSYIPSYLPKFPNPHTYINTEVTNDVEISYRKAREIIAQNKRNSENSLYRYALNIHGNFCLFQMQYEEALDQAKSEVDKQQAERLAKRARYTDDFETVDTPEILVKQKISDDFFVLKPFPLNDPTMISIVDPLEDEEASENEANNGDDSDDEIDIDLDMDNDATERLSEDHHDSKLSDTQDELILSDSDEEN